MFKCFAWLAGLFIFFNQYAYAGERPVKNQVTLSTSVSKEVENDIFKAVLTISKQTENNDLASIYNQVNKQARKAFDIAKKYNGMDVATRNNTSQPIYTRGKIEGWRVIYSIELTTKQRIDLAELIGKLQSFMKLDGIYFMVSDERRKKTEDELIEKAIADFNGRAAIITKAQNKKLYSMVTMNVNTGNQSIHDYSMARDKAYMSIKSSAPPPIETGKQKISVTISGTIHLKE